ncbi:MAG: hypothetical protein ASARMPRED_009307 [Alectoria sarmentosa]|nr:MAG: hypothetical protein ASARMPRED_009307 [Alectoria sarmentosa]
MEGVVREKQQPEQSSMDKDREIEELKRQKRDFVSKFKELEANVASLRQLVTPMQPSSPEKQQQPPPPLFNLPARPPSPEKNQQPISVLANLPSRPKFTGFDTPGRRATPQPSLFTPTASPQMLPPRPPPISTSTEPTSVSNMPTTLPTRPGGLPKGTVPPLLPHHQSFGASQMPSPLSVPPALFQTLGTPNPSSGATEASACSSLPAARANSYYHGPTFHNIPVPQHSALPTIPSSIPPSFDFNQQKRNMWEKGWPAPPSTVFSSRPSPAGTKFGPTFGLSPSNLGPARPSPSSATPLFGVSPPQSATSTGAATSPPSHFGDHPGLSDPSFFGKSSPSSSPFTGRTSDPPSLSGEFTTRNAPSTGAIPGVYTGLGVPLSGTTSGASPLFGNTPRSSAQLVSSSTDFNPFHRSAATAPSSPQGPLFSNPTFQGFNDPQPPTVSSPISGPMPSEPGATNASRTHQGPIFQNIDLPPGHLPLGMNQHRDEARLQKTVKEAANHAVGNEREVDQWPVAQQGGGDSRWR